MTDFLFADGNIAFTVAIMLVAAIAMIEIVMLLIGFSVGDMLEAAIPDLDGFAEGPLSYLGFGKLPVGILLILYLTAFSLLGFTLQGAISTVGLPLLPGWAAGGLSFILATPVVSIVAPIFGKAIPQDETYVASRDDLIGSIGKIGTGTASADLPAQCKVPDGYGGHLYVNAVPLKGEDPINSGTEVIIVSRNGNTYEVTPYQ